MPKPDALFEKTMKTDRQPHSLSLIQVTAPGERHLGAGARYTVIAAAGVVVLAGLYFISRQNYLLFHSFAEGFSIVIAFAIFAVAWNSRRFMDNNYLLFIGIAYLFVGGLDFLHTLAYRGMGVFPGYGTNLATQLWISARYVEALSLVAAPLFIHRRLPTTLTFLGYALVTALLLASIFAWDIFPVAFVEGSGLTPFKIASEYFISALLLGAIWLLLHNRREFSPGVARLMVASLGITIASEMSFTLYTDAYGIANMIGHLLKVVSFYLIYKALVETGLTSPYNLLFLNLKRSEDGLLRQAAELAQANERLVQEAAIRERAEKLAQQNEAQYRNLFSGMTEAFAVHEIILDGDNRPCDYRFVETNNAFDRFTGLSGVAGRTVREVIPDIEPFWIETYGRVALTGEPVHFENFSQPLGRWYEVYAYSPVPGHFVTLFTDVTERKKAEEALQRAAAEWSTTFDAISDLVSIHDAEYRIVGVNRAFARTIGMQIEDIIGRPCHEVVHGSSCPVELCPHHRTIETGRPCTMEFLEPRLGIHLEVTTSPIFDGNGRFTGSVHVARDITERKRAEEALQRSNLELEAANRELEAFSYSVSHDLRAPLRSMEGFSDALIEDYGDKLDGEARKYLGYIQESSQLMAQLIDDLLKLSRMTRDELHLENVDLSELARSIGEEMAVQNPQCRVEFTVAPDMCALGDRRLLRIALENMLGNAWKFTAKVPSPRVEMGLRRDGDTLEYFVRDNGAGFDMKYADKLFQPFQRLHKSTDFAGAGIGLATVQRIIHRHGGKVRAESRIGHGATFYFTLQ